MEAPAWTAAATSATGAPQQLSSVTSIAFSTATAISCLGGLALLSLVYKRWKERPQRPLKIWAFDVSKQVFGSVMLHLANLVLSMFSAGHFEIRQAYQPNPCSFYLLNLGIDTTLGIPILYLVLLIINQLALYTPLARPPESIESGNYGNPPRVMWWFKQAVLYFLALLWMKFAVFILIQVFPVIVKIGDWALRWTEGNTALQIIFVMLLFPLIMNAIQYYIVDTFIKRKPLLHDEPQQFGEESFRNSHLDDERRQALLGDITPSDDESDAGDVVVGKTAEVAEQVRAEVDTEYSPAKDGTNSFPESSSSNYQLGRTEHS
ncbi:vacuolar membrane protein-domain-containing protein [Talaromyces proteolyticus]|uniref:Vacuolar membrane protein-domain-containing protein n=1 Tax=Talaromyces proteolyticus TaxID=1131652 RepID=A0AAD4L178_9EURO|nr:vacuolar membrane protein-domain-containing protein [Talaromyces proteolyticus]KAH8704736.1 vacuolar membrane protein-domain-containing protein [Talaromyces proteolyticus]